MSRVEWSLAPAVEDRAGNDEFPASSLLVREVEGEKVMTELVAELNRRSEHPKGPDSGRRWVVSFRVTQDEAATYMIGWRKHAGVSTAELDDRETYAAFVMVAEARTPGTTGKGRIWGLLTLRLSRSRLRTVQSDPQDLMAIGPQEWAHASSAANYEIAAGSPGAGGFLWKPFMSSAIMEQALVNNELQNRQTREQAWILLVRTLGAELATPMD